MWGVVHVSVVGETFVAIRADNSGFGEDLKAKITSAVKNPAVIAGAAVATATAAVAALASKSVDRFKELGGNVTTFSRLTGESAEASSRLVFAAERTGVGTEALATGVKRLSVNLASNNKALGDANIQYRDAKGALLPLDDTLGNIATKFKTMPNGIEKNRLAVQLFGRSGTDLIPILNKGRDGLAELAKQSDKYGLTLSQKNLDSIKKYKDAQRDLSSAVQGFQVQLGSLLLPVLAKLATAFNANVIPFIVSATSALKEKLGPAIESLSKNVAIAVDALVAGFANPDASIGTGVDGLTKIFLEFGTGLKTVFDNIGIAYGAFTDGFKDSTSVNNEVGAIATIFATFGADLKTVLDAAVIAWGAFKDGFKSADAVGAEVGPLATAFAAVGAAVKVALDILKEVATFFADHPRLVEAATKAIVGFKLAYEGIQFGKRTIDLVVTGIDTAKKALNGVLDLLAKIGSSRDVGIKITESAASSAAQGAAKGAGSSLGETATNVGSGAAAGALGNALDAKKAAAAVKTFVKVAFAGFGALVLESILPSLGGVASAIGAAVFSVPALIAAAVAAVALIVFHFRKGIVDFFANKLPGFVNDAVKAAPNFLEVLADKGVELIEGLLSGIKKALEEVFKFFADLPNQIAFAIGFVGGTLFKIGATLIVGLFEGIKFIFENVKDFFVAAPRVITDFLGDVTRTLFEKGRNILSGLFDGVKQIWIDVGTFFRNAASAIVGFVGDVAKTLYGKGQDLLAGLRDGIINIWQDPVKFFKDLPGNIVGFVGDVSQTLYSKGQDLITGLKSGIENLYDSAISKFRDLRKNVIDAVQNAASWLIEAGKDIIKGLLNGIGDAGSAVFGKLRDLGKSAIDGFKKGAGISSPSKYMFESGVFLMQGLSNGIDGSRRMVADAMDKVTRDVLGPLANPTLNIGGLGSAGAAGGLSIGTINIANNKSLQEQLDEIARLNPVIA